ncbi:MAG: hypothetical protein QOF60_3482 [Actinomycetota bacterium]|nr:hypothetical protein [Actinomycetota bacterium]
MVSAGFILLRKSPMSRAVRIAAGMAGALAALYPVGLRSRGVAAGFWGGLLLGLAVAVVTMPLWSAMLVTATLGGDEDLGMVQEYKLAGVSKGRRTLAAATAAFLTAAECSLWAIFVSAFAGLGDALRQGASLLGSAPAPGVGAVFALATAVYAIVLGVGAVAATRSAVRSGLLIAGGFPMFLGLLHVFSRGSWSRWILKLSPFGPPWALALPKGHSGIILGMGRGAAFAVGAGWLVVSIVAALTVGRSTRTDAMPR